MENQDLVTKNMQRPALERAGRLVGKGLATLLATTAGATIGHLVGREVGGPMSYDTIISFTAGGATLGLAGGLTYLRCVANQGRKIAKGAAILLTTLIGTGVGIEAGVRTAPPQYVPGKIFTTREYHTHITRSGEYGALLGAGAGALGVAVCKKKR